MNYLKASPFLLSCFRTYVPFDCVPFDWYVVFGERDGFYLGRVRSGAGGGIFPWLFHRAVLYRSRILRRLGDPGILCLTAADKRQNRQGSSKRSPTGFSEMMVKRRGNESIASAFTDSTTLPFLPGQHSFEGLP